MRVAVDTWGSETFIRKTSWFEAQKQSQGYEDATLIEALASAAVTQRPWERDINCVYMQAREMELLNALQMVGAYSSHPRTLDVADIGGGNGYMAGLARKFMPTQRLQWTIFESKSVSDAYHVLEDESDIVWRENTELNFDRIFDVAIASCVLNYVSKPLELLNFLSTTSRYLLLMRLPLIDEPGDIPTVQKPNEGIYAKANSSWPAWFLSRARFENFLLSSGEIILRWNTPTEVWQFEGKPIMLEGLLLRSKNVPLPVNERG